MATSSEEAKSFLFYLHFLKTLKHLDFLNKKIIDQLWKQNF